MSEIKNSDATPRAMRESAGISRHIAAKRLGIPTSTLAGYENGWRTPKVAVLAKMALAYNLTPDDAGRMLVSFAP